jgi:hypothetical protein
MTTATTTVPNTNTASVPNTSVNGNNTNANNTNTNTNTNTNAKRSAEEDSPSLNQKQDHDSSSLQSSLVSLAPVHLSKIIKLQHNDHPDSVSPSASHSQIKMQMQLTQEKEQEQEKEKEKEHERVLPEIHQKQQEQQENRIKFTVNSFLPQSGKTFLTEKDVGILEFIHPTTSSSNMTSLPSNTHSATSSRDITRFNGILKHRFSDFLVNEVDLSGKILHLLKDPQEEEREV